MSHNLGLFMLTPGFCLQPVKFFSLCIEFLNKIQTLKQCPLMVNDSFPEKNIQKIKSQSPIRKEISVP